MRATRCARRRSSPTLIAAGFAAALLPKSAHVRIDVQKEKKRPVMADADSRSVLYVQTVEIHSEPSVEHRLLFDPGHGLEERLIREQFV